MKKYFCMFIFASLLAIAGCGGNDEKATEYKVDVIVEPIQKGSNETSKETSDEEYYYENNGIINECFRDIMDRDIPILGFDALGMTEGELIQKYGNPDDTKINLDGVKLWWNFTQPTEGRVSVSVHSVCTSIAIEWDVLPCGEEVLGEIYEYLLLDPVLADIYKGADFSKISEYFDDGQFNNSYSFRQLKNYSDFVNITGSSGYFNHVNSDVIWVAWLYPEQNIIMSVGFDPLTGEVKRLESNPDTFFFTFKSFRDEFPIIWGY